MIIHQQSDLNETILLAYKAVEMKYIIDYYYYYPAWCQAIWMRK